MDNSYRVDEEKTIDLILVLVEVLRRIGAVLFCAVLFAVLLGGATAIRGYITISNVRREVAPTNLVMNETAQRQYEEALVF